MVEGSGDSKMHPGVYGALLVFVLTWGQGNRLTVHSRVQRGYWGHHHMLCWGQLWTLLDGIMKDNWSLLL